MEDLPDRLWLLLESLSLGETSELLEWAELADLVHRHRHGQLKSSAPNAVTRTSALSAAAILDEELRALLVGHDLDWNRFRQEAGIAGFTLKRPSDVRPARLRDLELDQFLARALYRYHEEFPEHRTLDPAKITFGVLATVKEDPEYGVVPYCLGQNLLANLPSALDSLRKLVASREDLSPIDAPANEGPVEPPEETGPPVVFISYSHRDQKWRDRLRQQLAPYAAKGRIRVWDDGDIPAGAHWRSELEAARQRAAAAVLLVSPDFFASEYITKREAPHLLRLHEDSGQRIFPLLIRACDWKTHGWLSELQIFPRGPRPLADGTPEEAESDLIEFARVLVDQVAARSDGSQAEESLAGAGEPPARTRLEATVPTHSDDPSLVDELGRRPFAEVVAGRIQEVWETKSGHGQAFMVQIHGPWGSGKTSVLNFMREQLEGGRLGARWVVVDFNAWRHEQIRPPWWALIREVYGQAARELGRDGWRREWKLRARWLLWRLRADWFPAIIALAVVLAVSLLVTRVLGLSGEAATAAGGDAGKQVDLWLKVVAAAFAVGATVLAASRALLLGSARAAKTYLELSRDPMRPIAALFCRLVKGIGRPVVVFIDDLDRCRSDYVVELLEGIQTLFRDAPVAYVVAADREWIRTSFEEQHEAFVDLGEPGRPLGHLFLEKMFQISSAVPEVSPEVRAEYWKRLLEAAGGPAPTNIENVSEQAEEEAWRILGNAESEEDLQRVIDEHRDDAVLQQGLRAAAAKRITAPEVRRHTEHRLQRYADYLESNPRAMKRLVNAYGIRQAVAFLERREVDPEVMALWTIIELRWPLLADLLAERPELVNELRDGKLPAAEGRIPEPLKPLFSDEGVRRLLRCKVGGEVLSDQQIRSVVGSA